MIGAFDFINLPTGGQPVKTRTLYQALCDEYGKNQVVYIETYGWKKRPVGLVIELFRKVSQSEIVIMLPAHNGVGVFSRLLLFSRMCWNISIYYDVIGGWLHTRTEMDASISKLLKRFDGIWVETSTMASALQNQGFTNVFEIPNFKNLTPVGIGEVLTEHAEPIRTCTFSRVMKEKGIEDAITAVKNVNESFGAQKVSLDIYGPIDAQYVESFFVLQEEFPDYINYKGIINPNESTSVLKYYDVLLFPTHFATEGVPGTIIDAYAASTPVISAKWQSFADVIDDGITGIGYEMDDLGGLQDTLMTVIQQPSKLSNMRKACIEKAKEYTPSACIKKMFK